MLRKVLRGDVIVAEGGVYPDDAYIVEQAEGGAVAIASLGARDSETIPESRLSEFRRVGAGERIRVEPAGGVFALTVDNGTETVFPSEQRAMNMARAVMDRKILPAAGWGRTDEGAMMHPTLTGLEYFIETAYDESGDALMRTLWQRDRLRGGDVALMGDFDTEQEAAEAVAEHEGA